MKAESAGNGGVRVVLLVEDGLLSGDAGEVVPAVPLSVPVREPVLEDVVVPDVLVMGVLLPHHQVIRKGDGGRVSEAEVIIHNRVIIDAPDMTWVTRYISYHAHMLTASR